MNDIDLSSIDNWEPIGTEYARFKGTFDGNGHVIKNLKIDRPTQDSVGLFGQASDGATIKNVGLENVDVKGGDCVGGLVGNHAHNTISNCYVSGTITGNNNTGGLVGNGGYDTISNCYVSGTITGNNNTGGLIGSCYQAKMSNCYVSGNVKGNGTTGLICGSGAGSTGNISNVWADKKDSTLGAFGEISITITNSGVISHKEFTSPEFWEKQNFDSDVWDMQNCYPPILKGLRGQLRNWYFKETNNEFRLQVGSGTDPAANALFVNTGLDLGGININLSTVEGCLDASRCAKAALDAVAKRTADIGIEQSRLETISNVNTTQIENLSAAYSTVTEADVAEEVANYTKAQILASTTASLITQTQNFQANLLLRMINSLG